MSEISVRFGWGSPGSHCSCASFTAVGAGVEMLVMTSHTDGVSARGGHFLLKLTTGKGSAGLSTCS